MTQSPWSWYNCHFVGITQHKCVGLKGEDLLCHSNKTESVSLRKCPHDHWPTTHQLHTSLTALCPGLPRWAGTRKVKPIWILLKQETVSGSDISWAICKSAHRSRHITTPAPHHSVFYRPDALPAAQPTASKHWRHWLWHWSLTYQQSVFKRYHSDKCFSDCYLQDGGKNQLA